MFTSCTDDPVKDQIITSFTKSQTLRLVCATVAFGVGLDCPDVHVVVHLGMPEDIEAYIQETGCAGQDGLPTEASLLNKRPAQDIQRKTLETTAIPNTVIEMCYVGTWRDRTVMNIRFQENIVATIARRVKFK